MSTGSKTADLGSYRDHGSVFKTGVSSAALKIDEVPGARPSWRKQIPPFALPAAKLAHVEMSSQESSLYRQVFKLMRILLVCPVSSSTGAAGVDPAWKKWGLLAERSEANWFFSRGRPAQRAERLSAAPSRVLGQRPGGGLGGAEPPEIFWHNLPSR